MMELGNIEQIKKALKGKTGLIDEYEEALIERVAIIEAEQDEGVTFPPFSKISAIVMVALSLLIVGWLFIQ